MGSCDGVLSGGGSSSRSESGKLQLRLTTES